MAKRKSKYSGLQMSFLVILRVSIGWHLMYEGISKLLNPNWSSVGFLLDSKGAFAEFFYKLAGNPDLLQIVDQANIWGLILIGLGLILGGFTKLALFSGIILLSSYYLSHPPLIGLSYAAPSEGNYIYINKNIIEIAAMLVLTTFPSHLVVGIDRLIFGPPKVKTEEEIN